MKIFVNNFVNSFSSIYLLLIWFVIQFINNEKTENNMFYKCISIDSDSFRNFMTQTKFEIATARAEECGILRIDIFLSEDVNLAKFLSSVKRSLGSMKQKQFIQFFAFPDNFERNGTEAIYLQNKNWHDKIILP